MTALPSKFFPKGLLNPADFPFSYNKFMKSTEWSPIAYFSKSKPKVAIVGAGAAGMVIAMELRRCGVSDITIFEASNRLGGRLWSKPAPGNTKTTYELGAMRMPLFGSDSLLSYYIGDPGGDHSVNHVDFPNPGSVSTAGTGIYLNNGRGVNNVEAEGSQLYVWDKKTHPNPPTPELATLSTKVNAWIVKFKSQIAAKHNANDWQVAWMSVINQYQGNSFQDIARAPVKASFTWPDVGGMGLSEKEVWLLYTVGTGDGGWGSFYQVSALWFIRCTIFGYTTDLQFFTEASKLTRSVTNTDPVPVTNGTLPAPTLLGIQSLPEIAFNGKHSAGTNPPCQLYKDVKSASNPNGPVKFYLDTKVYKIEKKTGATGKIEINAWHPRIGTNASIVTDQFDAVFVTPTTWSMQISERPPLDIHTATNPGQIATFQGFDDAQFPALLRSSQNISHNIRSGKIFFSLKKVGGKRYWEQTNVAIRIPQVILTDNYLQGIYGYAAGDDPGVILISYSWEDDANKLLAGVVGMSSGRSPEMVLAEQELAKLDNMLQRAGKESIRPYIDNTVKPTVHFWSEQSNYRACAKLYYPHSEELNLAMLTHNEKRAKLSGLYFAGESYSVEGGWTEPALRSAIDAVIRFAEHWGKHSGSTVKFKTGFNVSTDYPSWDVLRQ